MDEKLKALTKPFPAEYVAWRPGATNQEKTAALGLAYVDPRCYHDRLNEVFGMKWSDKRAIYLLPHKIAIEVTITVEDNDGHLTSRSGMGEEFTEDIKMGGRSHQGNENSVTGADAQAFKRACVEFGLGAYLYGWGNVWADYDSNRKRFTDKGISKLNQTAHNLTEQTMRQWAGDERAATGRDKPLEQKAAEGPEEPKEQPETKPIKKESTKVESGKGPQAVKVWLLSEAEKASRKQRPLTTKDVKELAPLLNNVLGNDEARKAWLKWTYGIDSANDLTGAQKDVLWETMRPTYVPETTLWEPTGENGQKLVTAIKAMYQEALRESASEPPQEEPGKAGDEQGVLQG